METGAKQKKTSSPRGFYNSRGLEIKLESMGGIFKFI